MQDRHTPRAKPSVTAIVLGFNCERFMETAVQSALEQDYDGPLEVVVSDDASTDNTFAIAQEVIGRYLGPHDVALHKRTTNSGSKSAHLNDVFPRCRGEILISFDGDDCSEPSRVTALARQFAGNGELYAAYSSYLLIDTMGQRIGKRDVPHPPPGARSDEWFARVDAYAAGATLAIRRRVVTTFGPLPPDIHEDVLLPFRASLLGDVKFIATPLVRARRHAESLTADWQRFDSLEHFRARMALGIERARRSAASRQADIQAACQLMPERADRLKRLEQLVRASLANAESTLPLLSPSLMTRLRTLGRLIRAGAYERELLQHTALALAPNLYLRYKRQRLGIVLKSKPPGT